MGVQISGGTASERAVAKTAYRRVREILPYKGDVSVQILAGVMLGMFSPLPPGVEARSTPQGVQILGAAIRRGPPGRPEYLLYEEIAHHIAADRGLPHDGNAGMFLQELFGGFVKFTLAREHDPQLMSNLTIPEIGTTGWQRFYGFGTDLGALIAGMDEAEPVIDRFLAKPAVPRSVRTRGEELKADLLSRRWTAPKLLDRCLAFHPELKRAWNPL